MMPTELTVAEFAAKHCADCGPGDDMREKIQSHVNLLCEAAISTGHALWKVGIDPEGRVSLIWSPMPEDLWEVLLGVGIRLQEIKRQLGAS